MFGVQFLDSAGGWAVQKLDGVRGGLTNGEPAAHTRLLRQLQFRQIQTERPGNPDQADEP